MFVSKTPSMLPVVITLPTFPDFCFASGGPNTLKKTRMALTSQPFSCMRLIYYQLFLAFVYRDSLMLYMENTSKDGLIPLVIGR